MNHYQYTLLRLGRERDGSSVAEEERRRRREDHMMEETDNRRVDTKGNVNDFIPSL